MFESVYVKEIMWRMIWRSLHVSDGLLDRYDAVKCAAGRCESAFAFASVVVVLMLSDIPLK